MVDVRFEHVYKRYGDGVNVISDLNLQVRDQEFLVLVGPSGCGKSTVLRLIAGLEEISEGDLYIGPRRVNDIAPKDRDIAMVFQNYALYPHMSVFDNMAFSLTLRHLPGSEIAERVRNAATMLGIRDHLQRKPRELSGGQRQRVALGRAIVREPKVFLMDEPLSNLDAKLRVQTRADIARLHQQAPTTTVYVTHDQVEAMTMGDRIAVLNAGIIQQLGTPTELYETPANLFVAGFIGSPSMDFFHARLVRQGGSAPSVLIGDGADERKLLLQGTIATRMLGQATADGRRVILGIRPEDFTLAEGTAEDTLVGTVDVVEHLGNEQVIYVGIPGVMMPETAQTRGSTVRLPAHPNIRAGQRLMLAVDTSRLHLFDPSTTDCIV
ncbi:MAG: ABC transporter ATP-binding protein [Ktedonobacterales bacterium]